MGDDQSAINGESLARIEGKIDLLNERNARNQDDIRDLRERAHGHSNRIGVLEADKHMREGETKGFDKALRAIYTLSAVCGLGSIAAVLRLLLPLAAGGH